MLGSNHICYMLSAVCYQVRRMFLETSLLGCAQILKPATRLCQAGDSCCRIDTGAGFVSLLNIDDSWTFVFGVEMSPAFDEGGIDRMSASVANLELHTDLAGRTPRNSIHRVLTAALVSARFTVLFKGLLTIRRWAQIIAGHKLIGLAEDNLWIKSKSYHIAEISQRQRKGLQVMTHPDAWNRYFTKHCDLRRFSIHATVCDVKNLPIEIIVCREVTTSQNVERKGCYLSTSRRCDTTI